MAITTLNSGDSGAASRVVINDNFTDLDTTKADLVSPSFTTPNIGAATGTSLALGGGTALTSTNQTGTGSLVLATTPTLTTPVLGSATATAIGMGLSASASVRLNLSTDTTFGRAMTVFDSSAGTLTRLALATFTQGDSELRYQINVGGTHTWGNGTTTDTNLYRSAADTLKTDDAFTAGKGIIKRAPTVTQSATPTINTDATDVAHITGLAQAITSMTTNLSGTPVEGDTLRIDITDNGTARAITWGSKFEASGNVALPTTTVISTRLDVGFVWNTVTSKWRCVAVA